MADPTGYTVRPARVADGDIDLFLRAHDEAVTYLCSIGSDQWGKKAFSQRPDAVQRVTDFVKCGEECTGKSGDDLPGSYAAAFVADDASSTPRGVAAVSDGFPAYVTEQINHDAVVSSQEAKDFLYLDDLVSIRSTDGAKSKMPAGTFLIEHAKQLAITRGKRYLYCDCYNAPPYRLVEYYKKHGFHPIGRFEAMSKHTPGALWPGILLRLDLA